ncbi:MAG: hydrogenase maturation protease [Caldithrix sp.]|nr:hydrogenase maturation protease [Caldithrix sp.]
MLKVIGLGNELRGDDGIGPHIIKKLNDIDRTVPLQLVNAGSDAFIILDYLRSKERMLLIDCANVNKKPGTVSLIDLNETTLAQLDQLISLHGFGFAEMYRMAQSLGQVAPCKVIAVQPKTIEFGQELSPEVQQAVPHIIKLVIEEANKDA